MQRPVDHYSTPPMGEYMAWRASGKGHQGEDYYAPRGTPIYAVAPGRVISVAYSGSNAVRTSWSAQMGFGHNVTIEHDDGFIATYAHMNTTPLVKYGQRVNDGGRRTQLGVVGDSGNAWAVGCHCHFQVVHGRPPVVFDPESLFGTSLAGSGTLIALPDPAVKELQKQLTELGYDPGTADGFKGAHTLAAIKAFQKAANLTVDGFAGPKTLAAIKTAIDNKKAAEAAEAARKAEEARLAKIARETIFDMDLLWDNETNQSGYLGTPNGITPLTREEYLLFKRRIDAYRAGKEETFNKLQIQIMNNVLARAKAIK